MNHTSQIEQDTRVLYDFGAYQYTVSDVDKIYQTCKACIDQCDLNDFKSLYEMFKVRQKHPLAQSRSEITGCLATRVSAFANFLGIENIKKEVRKCRRKFYYWGDLPEHIYFINEKLNYHKRDAGRLNPELETEDRRLLYDCWIANACYQLLLDPWTISEQQIEADKCFMHKLDWEYAMALRYFSGRYDIDRNLTVDTDRIFRGIYDEIRRYGPLAFYTQILHILYVNFNQKEKRIMINQKANPVLPTLLNYSIKALPEDTGTAGPAPSRDRFQRILKDTEQAIKLLDVDNEHDLEFLIPTDEGAYLERIMNYSAVYDIHQYVPEGMLFLLHRIIDGHSAGIEKAFGCTSKEFRDIIDKLVRKAQQDFENGTVSKLPLASLSGIERGILNAIAATGTQNQEYLIPTQWDKVNSDSEWVIKLRDAYYIIPPIVSALGVYDKIGQALGWTDFGPQIEQAVLALFQGITGLACYSGKYLFEGEIDECDAVIKGTEYALIIECKRKGVSRVARGGKSAAIAKDFAETYLSSQAQAYRMQRAIEEKRVMDFYPAELDISTKESHNEKYSGSKTTADFTQVKRIIRITCTGGSFWIATEIGIAGHIEDHIREYQGEEAKDRTYADRFIEERDKLLMSCQHDAKAVKLDKLFLSFDKLYDIVMILQKLGKSGDELLQGFYQLTRVGSQKNDTTNHLWELLSF